MSRKKKTSQDPNVEVILCSFSGGRTSAYMAKILKEKYETELVIINDKKGNPLLKKHVTKDKGLELIFVFANTGKEREETLVFVDKCDKAFGLEVNWVEANVFHGKRKSTGYKLVNFETASRKGEPFEEVIKKYGISNQAFPHCTRELKLNPIKNYMKDCGYENYKTALGIRIDEARRIGFDPKFIYPLYETSIKTQVFIDTKFIREFWNKQDFDLELKDYEGNCDLCWKKSLRKKLTLIQDDPKIADWWIDMEEKYGEGEYNFHRNNTPTKELIDQAKQPFIRHDDPFSKENRCDEMDAEKECACRTIIDDRI